MRLSLKVAMWLIVANFALMTAPGMVLLGIAGAPLEPWLPPLSNSFDFVLSGATGLFWPMGIPVIMKVMDRWKARWGPIAHGAVALITLYLWAVVVVLGVLLQFGKWVPLPEVKGYALQLDRSSDIKGPDTDHNGIRDDIDAWIAAQPISDAQKKAARQMARVQQAKLMADLNDKAALQVLGDQSIRAVSCIVDSFDPEFQKGAEMRGQLEAMMANTKERAKQYIAYNRARSGSVTELPSGNTCEP